MSPALQEEDTVHHAGRCSSDNILGLPVRQGVIYLIAPTVTFVSAVCFS